MSATVARAFAESVRRHSLRTAVIGGLTEPAARRVS